MTSLKNPSSSDLTTYSHILYEFASPVNIGSLIFVSEADTDGRRRHILRTWLGTGKTVYDYNDPDTSVACNGGNVHSNQGTINCEYEGATALHILWYPVVGSENTWWLYEIYAFDENNLAQTATIELGSENSWTEADSNFPIGSANFDDYSGDKTSMITRNTGGSSSLVLTLGPDLENSIM